MGKNFDFGRFAQITTLNDSFIRVVHILRLISRTQWFAKRGEISERTTCLILAKLWISRHIAKSRPHWFLWRWCFRQCYSQKVNNTNKRAKIIRKIWIFLLDDVNKKECLRCESPTNKDPNQMEIIAKFNFVLNEGRKNSFELNYVWRRPIIILKNDGFSIERAKKRKQPSWKILLERSQCQRFLLMKCKNMYNTLRPHSRRPKQGR